MPRRHARAIIRGMARACVRVCVCACPGVDARGGRERRDVFFDPPDPLTAHAELGVPVTPMMNTSIVVL